MSGPVVPPQRIIVALDRPDTEANLAIVRALRGRARWYKVGMKQFFAGAQPILDAVREDGASIFLDLKLHDIPETVRGGARALAWVRPELFTVHAAGGASMVAAAVEGLREGGCDSAVVLGVTVLTSLSAEDLDGLGVSGGAEATVTRWARLAVGGGAGGIVCSPQEVASLRSACPGVELVTPGVRPAGSASGDQKRIATPAAALAAGATRLVIGRPIVEAADPVAAFEAIMAHG